MAERNYKTQMEAAKEKVLTPEMKVCAAEENITEEELREQIAKGIAVIPANPAHKGLVPHAVGSKLTTKINVNLRLAATVKDYDIEMQEYLVL